VFVKFGMVFYLKSLITTYKEMITLYCFGFPQACEAWACSLDLMAIMRLKIVGRALRLLSDVDVCYL
jgi:hypothetical protein